MNFTLKNYWIALGSIFCINLLTFIFATLGYMIVATIWQGPGADTDAIATAALSAADKIADGTIFILAIVLGTMVLGYREKA